MSNNMSRSLYCIPINGDGLFVSLAVIGELGAVEFCFTFYPPNRSIGMGDKLFDSAGVEIHRKHGEGEPDHTDCRLVGRCWDDGGNLQAREQFVPAIMSGGSDLVYDLLESRYAAHFSKRDGERE